MYLPDAFRAEVTRFFDSPAGKAFMIALQLRRPASIDPYAPAAHTLLDSYATQKGFDICLAEISRIPQEMQPQLSEVDKQIETLTNPRD